MRPKLLNVVDDYVTFLSYHLLGMGNVRPIELIWPATCFLARKHLAPIE